MVLMTPWFTENFVRLISAGKVLPLLGASHLGINVIHARSLIIQYYMFEDYRVGLVV